MRQFVLLLLALAAACAPPSSSTTATPPPPAQTSADDSGLTSSLDGGHVASGQWVFRADEGVTSACFTGAQSACQVAIQCEAPTQTLTVTVNAAITPDQDAAIQIYTDQTSMTLFAQSHNEGLPSVVAVKAPGNSERTGLIELFSSAPRRFGVEARKLDGAGEISVFPWDDAIKRVLHACR